MKEVDFRITLYYYLKEMKLEMEEEPTIFAPVIYESPKEREGFFDVI